MYEQASRFPVSRVPVYYLARQLSPSVRRNCVMPSPSIRGEKASVVPAAGSNGDSRDSGPIAIAVPTPPWVNMTDGGGTSPGPSPAGRSVRPSIRRPSLALLNEISPLCDATTMTTTMGRCHADPPGASSGLPLHIWSESCHFRCW